MAMNEDVVLHPRTGAPWVLVTRSDDGHLTFRLWTIRQGGGMAIARPVSDEAMAEMHRSGEGPGALQDQVAQAGRAVRRLLDAADEVAGARARELEAQLGEVERELEAERLANAEAGNRLGELVRERDEALARVAVLEARRGPGRPPKVQT